MKKIDIHCHTSKRKIRDVASESATVEYIADVSLKYDIKKTVLLATYFPHKRSGITNFRLLNWINEFRLVHSRDGLPEFLMFGSLDFEHYFYQGYNELEEMCSRGLIHGIKIYTCYQNINIKSPEFKKIVKLARLFTVPLMFHTGYSYASLRKYGRSAIGTHYDAKSLEPIADNNADVVMIFSHMSKPYFDEMICVAKKYPNVVTDMSGIIDSVYNRDQIGGLVNEIGKFLYECGPKKLLFGTDFPVQTHEDSIHFIETAMEYWSEWDRKDVYYNNANKILNRSYLE